LSATATLQRGHCLAPMAVVPIADSIMKTGGNGPLDGLGPCMQLVVPRLVTLGVEVDGSADRAQLLSHATRTSVLERSVGKLTRVGPPDGSGAWGQPPQPPGGPSRTAAPCRSPALDSGAVAAIQTSGMRPI
jgi:hypothetical protein